MENRFVQFLLLALLVGISVCLSSKRARCPSDGSCALPNCYCAQTKAPGGIDGPNLPQIVFLTFDDAVTITNYPVYDDFLTNRTNPNGAPVSATFFINHEYTNYSLVNQLWRKGHEIAVKSITHTTTTQYWATINETIWTEEIIEQRKQLQAFANMDIDDIRGMRAPFLQIGGDPMYRAMVAGGLAWEASRPTQTFRNPGLWPYTNDYDTIQDCQIAPCPTGNYPGFWTVPIVDYIGGNNFACSMVDQCLPTPETQQDMFELLLRNFNNHYSNGRAPFGVYTRTGWLEGPPERPEFAERKAGYIQFLNYLGTFNDVFIVSISKGLEWIKDPTGMGYIWDFDPWKGEPELANNCLFPRNCRYSNSTWERFMGSCVQCPNVYPWIFNPLGA